MIKKNGSAIWKGGLKDGTGEVTTESGVLSSAQYGFNKRFEGEPGTNPEELIGAAHASCYAMALSMILGQDDLTADEINAKSEVTLEQKDDGFAVTKIHLDVTAKVPGADESAFMKAANAAKSGCPISKLMNAEITMDAKLTS